MKNKGKKSIAVILITALMMSLAPGAVFGDDSGKITALSGEKGALKWSYNEGNGYSSAPTPPVLIKDNIYIGVGNKVKILDKDSGKVLKTSGALKGRFGYATIPLTYVEEKNIVLAPLNDGQIQALDADSLESLWVTEKRLGHSSNDPIVSDGGYFYTGTWYTDTKDGYYQCFSLEDEDPGKTGETKAPVWQVAHEGGFYWSGAAVEDGKVVFASENGQPEGKEDMGGSKLYCCMDGATYERTGGTDPVISQMDIKGDGRSTVVYSREEQSFFFTTKAGLLYKVKISDGGDIEESSVRTLDMGGASVGPFTLYEERLYIGTTTKNTGGSNGTSLIAVNENTMEIEDIVKAGGRVQGGVTILPEEDGQINIFGSRNTSAGDIFRITGDISGREVSLESVRTFFTPANVMKEYCISPIATDGEALYYKNDSCTVMAVACDVLAQPFVTLKAGKKNMTVKWTRAWDSDGYEIYRAQSLNGKYKKVKTITKESTLSWKNTGLKAKKKYYYKVRAYEKKGGGKKGYGLFSSAKGAKTKK